MPFRSIAAIALLAAAALLYPAAGRAARDEYQVIVLGGGTSDAEAEAALAAWPRIAGPQLRAAAGFPKKIDSASVKGLRAGFRVAVAGYCSDKKEAARLRDLLRLSLAGVYLRSVRGPFSGQCPTLAEPPRASEGPETRIVTRPIDAEVKSVALELAYAGSEYHGGSKNYYTDLRLRAVAGGRVLHELRLAGSFDPKRGIAGLGTLRTPQLVTLGKRTLVLVTEEERKQDHGISRNVLYGFYGGVLREMGQFKEYLTLASTGDDWREMNVYLAQKGPEEGVQFRFDEAKGSFQPDPAEQSTPRKTGGAEPPMPIVFESCDTRDNCCVTSNQLQREVTLHRSPSRESAEVATVPAGTEVHRVEFINVIDDDLSQIEVLAVPDCNDPGDDPPRNKAYYLYYAEENQCHVWMDGEFTTVSADCIVGNPSDARPTSWARITLKGGKKGYTDDLDAFERAGNDEDAGCLFGERRRVP